MSSGLNQSTTDRGPPNRRATMLILRTISVFLVIGLSGAATAQESGIDLGNPKEKITEPKIKALMGCKFTYKLKAGMTNAEAAQAIDAGWQRFTGCLRAQANKARTTEGGSR
jgi:hypothetical protein